MTHAPSTPTNSPLPIGTLGRRAFLGGVSAVGAGVAMASVPVSALAQPTSPSGAPTGLEPGRVLLDDSCADLAAAGWEVSPVANPGSWTADHPHSVANPMGVDFGEIPVGQYRMHANPLAGIHISADGMANELPLGAGRWAIAFRMAIHDLMQPYRLPQSNGLRLWVECGDVARTGRYFDFNFMPTGEVCLVMAGGAYETVKVPGGWDGEFHDWQVTFDGVETVRLWLDGTELTAWTYNGSAVVLDEGITFYNRTLDGVSGTNEIRFDHIGVTATQDLLVSDRADRWTDHWQVTPPADAVHFGDAEDSAGTSTWVANPIPAGSYLVRTRQTGHGEAVWTDPHGPGDGDWSVHFTSRFAQFAYSGVHADAQRIIAGIDVVAGGVRTKVGWRPDGAVVGLAADGSLTVLDPPRADQNVFARWTVGRHDSVISLLRNDVPVATIAAGPSTTDDDRVAITVGDPEVYGALAIWFSDIDIVRGHPQIVDTANQHDQWWHEPVLTGAALIPDGVPAKAGEYLLKATAGDTGHMDLRFPIHRGDGQWHLDTTLRFPDLRIHNSDRSHPEPIFGWEVIVDHTRWCVGIRPDLSVVAATEDGWQQLTDPHVRAWSDAEWVPNATWRLGVDSDGRLIVRHAGRLLGVVDSGVVTSEHDRVRLFVGSPGTTGPVAAVVTTITIARHIDPVWFRPAVSVTAVDPTSTTASVRAEVEVSQIDPDWAEDPTVVLRWSLTGPHGRSRKGSIRTWTGTISIETTAQHAGEHTLEVTLLRGSRTLGTTARLVQLPAPGTDRIVPLPAGAGWTDQSVRVGADLGEWTTRSPQPDAVPLTVDVAGLAHCAISIGVLGDSTGIGGVVNGETYAVTGPDGPQDAQLVEWFVTTADLSGGSIELIGLADESARVAYVRLHPLSATEIGLAATPVEGAAGRRAVYNNDATTDIVLKDVTDAEGLREVSAGRYRDTDTGILTYGIGATTLAWANSRVLGTIAETYDLTEAQFALMRAADRTTMEFMKAVVTDDECPLQMVAEAADDFGLTVLASLRMSAFYSPGAYPWLNGPHYGDHFPAHRMIGVDGAIPSDSASLYGLSLTFDDYRDLLVDALIEAGEYRGVDGVEIDLCRRPRVIGWDAAFQQAYHDLYGVWPPDEVPGPGLDRLLAHRAEILTEFLRRVRAGLPGKKVAVRVPYGYLYELGMDVETWIADGLIDILIPSTWTLEDLWSVDSTFPDLVVGTDVVLYGGIEAVINGMDSSRASENLAAAGVSSNVASARMTRPQYLQRAQEFYDAGYDGVYIFNNPSGAHSLGRVGDKVAVAQWAAFARPTETVRESITLL